MGHFVCSLNHSMNINDIINILKLHWNTFWEMTPSHLKSLFLTAHELLKLRRNGIDVIASCKGYHYITLIV